MILGIIVIAIPQTRRRVKMKKLKQVTGRMAWPTPFSITYNQPLIGILYLIAKSLKNNMGYYFTFQVVV